MKIVQMLYYPGQGGTEEVIYLSAKEAKKNGDEIEFIFGTEGPFVKSVKELGFPVHFVKMRSFFDILAIISLIRLFKKIKPDVIQTHFLRENFLAIIAGKICGIKTFSAVHRIEPKTKLQAFFNKLYSHWLTSFIAVSEATKDYLINEGIESRKIEVVYNGIELPEDIARKDSRCFTIGFVGRLNPVKNIPLFLDAVKLINEKTNLKVVIVGEGPEKERLEAQVEELKLDKLISFEGYSDNPAKYYMSFDVLVLPSKREVLSMSILEALSFGVSVIASNVGGIPEVIKDGKNGLLFENGNVKELRAKIELLMSDTGLKNKLSKGALETSKNFTAEKMYQNTRNLYRRFLEE